MYFNTGHSWKWKCLSSALALLYIWHIFIGTHRSVNIHVWGSKETLYFTARTTPYMKDWEKTPQNRFISGECTFSGSFCISTMTPGPFISCIGKIILLDLHMKGQHSLLNKKGTFFFLLQRIKMMNRTFDRLCDNTWKTLWFKHRALSLRLWRPWFLQMLRAMFKISQSWMIATRGLLFIPHSKLYVYLNMNIFYNLDLYLI